jgi:hypothetical protein
MTFWQAFKATYSGGTAFLFACPLLALVPVAFELLQHVIEVHIGMYDSIAAARTVEHHPLRMGFGMLKVGALIAMIYWVTRFLLDRDARFAATLEPRALRLFAGYLAFSIAMAAFQLFALPQTSGALLAGFFVSQIIGCVVVAWGVAAALGNPAVGPRASVEIMAPHVAWTFVFSLVVMLPLMIPHYALAAAAMLGPKPMLWPILIGDSLLVSWLTAALSAGAYYAAIRAARKAGVDLAGSTGKVSATA